jgi:hypothetical protein
MVKTMKLSRASKSLADYAAELGDDIIVLTDREKPIAAIVPLRGVDADTVTLSGHPGFPANHRTITRRHSSGPDRVTGCDEGGIRGHGA